MKDFFVQSFFPVQFSFLSIESLLVDSSQAGDSLRVVYHIVRQINEKLGKASLGCCVISQNGRERGVTKRLGQALAKSLTGTGIITESTASN